MNSQLLKTVLAPLILFVAAIPGANAAGPDCDRSCLKGFVDTYIAALAKRDPSRLPVVPALRYTENGRDLNLGAGIWTTAGEAMPYRDYFIDTYSGQVAVFTALRDFDSASQMLIRLKIQNRKISEIETIVARRGDHSLFMPDNLKNLSNIFDQPVSVASRQTRTELMATADSYFVAMETEGTPQFKQAPFADGMKRIENGLQTTSNNINPIDWGASISAAEQLDRAFFKGVIADNRRYPIVDVDRGVVLAILAFRPNVPGAAATVLISEAFKITDGKLAEIRAIMVNLSKNASTGWEE